ncbi:MAG: type VII secretion protein EssC [Ruminococcus sp.]|nr:type VII secretion protein EssC [Ruminococcus sp.]
MTKYILYIHHNDRVIEYPLPATNDRMVNIDLSIIGNNLYIPFEVFDGKWTITSDHNIRIKCNDEIISKKTISNGEVYNISYSNNTHIYIVVLSLSPDITEFKKYDISNLNRITIGRNSDCDISINDRFISSKSKHAVFERKGNDIYVSTESKNGIFINGERVKQQTLIKNFDVIYSVGLKIVIVNDIFAINKAYSSKVNNPKLRLVDYNKIPFSKNTYTDDGSFFRTPRIIEPLYNEPIEIEAPPSKQKIDDKPVLFMLGPSLTMPLPILASVMVNSAIRDTSATTYLGSIISVLLAGGVGGLWALANQRYTKNKHISDETAQIDAYKRYIENNDRFIAEKHEYNKNLLCKQYLSSMQLIQCTFNNHSLIWNRNKNHDDFLTVRLGLGKIKFQSDITIPKDKFTIEDNPLLQGTKRILERYEYMDNSPILLNLKEDKIVGVIGNKTSIQKITNSLIVQISALHSYTDVKMAMFFKENELSIYSWIKWIPHFWDEEKKVRMIADNKHSNQNILFTISSILRARSELIADGGSNTNITFLPHYVVLCTSSDIFENESIEKYIRSTEDLGVTFILIYGTMDRLYNECIRIIQCDDTYKGMYLLNDTIQHDNNILFDEVSKNDVEQYARTISNFYIKEFTNSEIPSAIDYFQLLGISKIEQWNLLKRYKENRSYEHISSLIGVSSSNKPMYLDIHEKAHGPHGLVAGTTGSGKSETIQTFIISLALNYSPDEVAFILIDYKGGGMAQAFEGMPHLVGMITNLTGNETSSEEDFSTSLDENQTRRALISIKSEIKRRQALFNNYKVNHIDNYTRLYRNGVAIEPMPHLIIISDEFAELKKEQPDFIKELVSTARVGRSLGIHLILATQKPSGVVDDEIWTNSRFKLCLKVQDKQDSIGMLKRPEASSITVTGRGYLQVGNDEIFEMFQTGYSGADYIPKDEFELSQDNELQMIELDGSKSTIRTSKKRNSNDIKPPSQLKICVDYITKTSRDNNIQSVKPIWLPPLPTKISLEYLESKYKVKRDGKLLAQYGLIDDPERQKQYPATIDFYACSNVSITGISGYGKTTLLETILFSLCLNYTSLDFNFYIMDFSSATLNIFQTMPQCGGVVLSDDVELINRLLTLIRNEMGIRKELFKSINVGNYDEYIKVKKIPLILFVIDNFSVFREEYNDLIDELTIIIREGIRYGIKSIVIDNDRNNIPNKIDKNLSTNITLRLTEKANYLDVLKVSPSFMPTNCKGRGLLNMGRVLEFQAAVLFEDVNINSKVLSANKDDESFMKQLETKRMANIKNKMDTYTKFIIKKNGRNPYAKPIPFIPKDELYPTFFKKSYKPDNNLNIPIGYESESISYFYLDLHRTYCYTFSDFSLDGINLMINNLITAGRFLNAEIYMINFDSEIFIKNESVKERITTIEKLIEFMYTLKDFMIARTPVYKEYQSKNPNADNIECVDFMNTKFNKIFVIIDNLEKLCTNLYGSKNYDASNFFEEFLEKGANRGIYFFAGIKSSDFSSSQAYSKIFKNFTKDKNGLNTGGRLDQQKIVNCQSMRTLEQSKVRDYNIAHTYYNKKLLELYIPKYK